VVNNTKVLPLLLWNKFGSKVILFARGWFMPQQINGRDRFLYRHLVDRYCCVSEATRYALVSAGIGTLSNTFVVHNSIDLQKIQNVSPAEINAGPDDTKILVSGGFLPTKGIHIAVEVARQLKEKGFPFKLIITGVVYDYRGSKAYYRKILQMIEDYALTDHIQLEIGRSSVLQFFKASDIFMHPSDTEGLPRVIMEAMAFRVPVVANAVGGVVDYVLDGYTGVITRYNNVDDYVDAIMRISSDPALRKRITDNAYELIETCYRPEQQVNAFERSLQ
jgi:glycosyltransferase involved in cell wall biosynthesis